MAKRDEPARREPRDVMQQRIYVGVTGLAVVFLLTLLAASLLALFGQDTRGTPSAAANAAAGNAVVPNEPLAELGVAPGNQPKPAAANAAAAAPVPPLRR